MKIKDLIIYNCVQILCAVAVILFLRYCHDPGTNTQSTTIIEKHNFYDSSKKIIPIIHAPGTVSFYPVQINVKTDTAAIGASIRNYFASFTYSQVIQDTSLRATIFDSISQNRVMGRKFMYQLLKPIRTVENKTVTIIRDNQGLYVGMVAPFKPFGFGPILSYNTKSDMLITAAYDVLNKAPLIGLQFKINARSNRKIK